MAEAADAIARDLVAWASGVLPKVETRAVPLGAKERKPGIDIRLIGLQPRPAPRSANPPNTIDLDYLVTAQLDDPLAEQTAIAELMLAAHDRSDFEVIAARPGSEICAALGIPVAAGFVIRTPLTREREAKKVPLVRMPLRVVEAQLGVVEGRVVGPGDVPVSGAVVTLSSIGRQTRTDAHGRFRIVGAPQDPHGIKLNVKARGVELDGAAIPGKSVVLRLPLEV